MRGNTELDAARRQSIGERLPVRHREHHPEMRHGHVMAVDRVRDGVGVRCVHAGLQVGDDLVAEQVEVDPFRRAAPLRAAEQPAIEAPRRGEIVDGKGDVEGAKLGHRDGIAHSI